jgi:NIMA (never in mitosis gene a)-related kinase
MSLNDFQTLGKLGEGAYSSVYKVKRINDGCIYALKKVRMVNLSEKEKENALNEVRILASIQNPYIISYKEAFVDDSSQSLWYSLHINKWEHSLVMEFADNGDLFQKICEHQKNGSCFSENEIWSVFIQIVTALRSLHDLKILHRDLKVVSINN